MTVTVKLDGASLHGAVGLRLPSSPPSSRAVTTSSSAQSGGVYKLICADVTLTASGGSVAAFRYIVLYNDTPTSPADPLVGNWDYGSSLTLNDTESVVVDFDGTNGVLQLT